MTHPETLVAPPPGPPMRLGMIPCCQHCAEGCGPWWWWTGQGHDHSCPQCDAAGVPLIVMGAP